MSHKLERGEKNKPIIVVNHKDAIKYFHPEEITAIILIKMKQLAEN